MKVDVVSESDIGQRRESNQDSVFVDQNKKLFIIADGMGGHLGGKEASEIAIKSISQNFYQHKNSPRQSCPQRHFAPQKSLRRQLWQKLYFLILSKTYNGRVDYDND